MGNVSKLEFGLVMWCQTKLILEQVEFTLIYQGRYSNFREGTNLTEQIEKSVAEVELKDIDIFVSPKNLVLESIF